LGHGHDDLYIRSAREDDLSDILGLREHLAGWLSEKGLDQWQEPWPDKDEQTRRIVDAIRAGATWMVCDGKGPVATITFHDQDRGELWFGKKGAKDPALYISRMMVHRRYAGRGIGAVMLDSAEDYAATLKLDYIRLDAWTTNQALHAYYTGQGFEHVGRIWEQLLNDRPDLDGYPSTALFQRRVRPAADRPSSRHADEKGFICAKSG
jgi:GNAT superfamily N-acetyltransferase